MMDTIERVVIRLPLVFCLLTDYPPGSNIDCSKPKPTSFQFLSQSKVIIDDDDGGDYIYNGNNDTASTEYCYECPSPARFLLGPRGTTISDHGSSGHVICLVLWVLTVLFGVFGIFSNIFIISVLRKRGKQRSFDFLLVTLASFDLLTSFSVIISTTATITLFENWDLGPATVILYFIPVFLSVFGRSGSAFMTVLITIERYLVLTHPMKFVTWFSPRRVKAYAIGVAVLALLLNIPRFTSVRLGYNEHGQEVPSLRGMKWIILPTGLEGFWYRTLKSVHYQIDIWMPFPVLLIFNILLFIEITKFSRKRQELTSRQRKDIRAARMFFPVVILLFFCNIEPIIHYIILHFKHLYYRELALGFDLSIAMNAAVNLPIYYSRGSSFREEIRAVLPTWIKVILGDNSNTAAATRERVEVVEPGGGIAGGTVQNNNINIDLAIITSDNNTYL